MRNLRRPALRLASAFVIFSPVYSAIFLPALKWASEKQPWPSIGDFPMVKPAASLSFIWKLSLAFYLRIGIWSSTFTLLACTISSSTRAKSSSRPELKSFWPPTPFRRGRPMKAGWLQGKLLEFKAAGDQICLIANTRKLVAQASETHRIDGPVVRLNIVNTPHHRLGCLYKLVGHGHSI